MSSVVALFIISLLLLFGVLYWINHYANKYIMIEPFSQLGSIVDNGGPSTNHTVNMPINTNSTCTNMCGPPGRCSITGDQCITDVDCPGCRPPSTVRPSDTANVPGQNDAGKLTNSANPTYSTLTTDIGSRAKLYNKLLAPPVQYNEGVNTWRRAFDAGNDLYKQRYHPTNVSLKYPDRTTLSGQFKDDGPLAANAYL